MPKVDPSLELRHSDILEDPFIMFEVFWPHLRLYDRQMEIVQSVVDNDETIVPAANAMGKDFISGFVALWFFCSRTPARVVTTSVDQSQLKGVLWGEMRRFINDAKYALPIQVNDLLIRQLNPDGTLEPRSELIGRVAQKGEGLLGRHLERNKVEYDKLDEVGKADFNRQAAYDYYGNKDYGDGKPRCLVLFDEASGMEDMHYNSVDTWVHRKLIIGNCYECENFFKKGVEKGDEEAPEDDLTPFGEKRYYRKIIRIKAEDSPNVRLALAEKEQGMEPSHQIIVPGVMDYRTYTKRRNTWDERKQTIGLDARWYEGEEMKMYPPKYLTVVMKLAMHINLIERLRPVTKCMGVDPAEGGDSTVWTIGDDYAVDEQIVEKTPDTSVIPARTIALLREYRVLPEDCYFDRGGGGKQHVDALRRQGFDVNSVGFGESAADISIQYQKYARNPDNQLEEKEDKYVFKNRRAEMYFMARLAIGPPIMIWDETQQEPQLIEDPDHIRMAIDPRFEELLRQMSKIPLLYDPEGRIYLPPKSKPTESYTGVTIKGLLGCSPDELDSYVLMVYGAKRRKLNIIAGSS